MRKKNNNSENRARGSSISFTPDQLESIDDLAKAMHMSRSALVVECYKLGVPILLEQSIRQMHNVREKLGDSSPPANLDATKTPQPTGLRCRICDPTVRRVKA